MTTSTFAKANREIDLLNLASQSVPLRKSGQWYIGPCPFCGGRDRFNLKQADTGWVWFCRKCGEGKYHTAVDFMLRSGGMTGIKEAYKPGKEPQAAKTGRTLIDEARWQERANRFIDQSCYDLFLGDYKKPLEYLTLNRKLEEGVLVRELVGYNKADRYEAGEQWGFEKNRNIWLPRGIVFPCLFSSLEIASLKIRRPDHKPKYYKLPGSQPGVFGYRNLRYTGLIAMTEGEIDCLTLEGEIGDLTGVCTLGSATDDLKNLDLVRWGFPFVAADTIFLFFDNDDSGRRGAQRLGVIDKAICEKPPDGFKDINEMHCRGLDIPAWFCRLVEKYHLAGDQAGRNPEGLRDP
jgi:DNA primase